MEQIENDGQIKYNHSMGQVISQYAKDTRFTNFLEIGTWNGGGSTYCFAKGFEARLEPFHFVSLEINEEMFNEAKEKYKNISYVKLYKGRILRNDELPPNRVFFNIFPNLNNEWLKDDMVNFFDTAYFDVEQFSPEVLLLDGSEYLTYFEFKKLEPTTKVFILDDINTEKCKKIVEELENNSNWKMKFCERDERNGWVVFERI
jgi:hypothetical protein